MDASADRGDASSSIPTAQSSDVKSSNHVFETRIQRRCSCPWLLLLLQLLLQLPQTPFSSTR
ncbi:hypothetical protein Ancab_029337 [Ancistrocladus abbreviatus]